MYQRNFDKIATLDPHKMMARSGVHADGVTFSEYVQKNLKLYQLEHDLTLSTPAAAHYIRNEVRLSVVLPVCVCNVSVRVK